MTSELVKIVIEVKKKGMIYRQTQNEKVKNVRLENEEALSRGEMQHSKHDRKREPQHDQDATADESKDVPRWALTRARCDRRAARGDPLTHLESPLFVHRRSSVSRVFIRNARSCVGGVERDTGARVII